MTEDLDMELQDSRMVVLALLNTIMGHVVDKEAVTACRELVEKLQDKWDWTHPRDRRKGAKVKP
jgi:hypothetical protein